MTLDNLKEKLQREGYNANIPNGSSKISVNGYGKKYFKAKKTKALSIKNELINQGYKAEAKECIDGFYDFYVSLT